MDIRTDMTGNKAVIDKWLDLIDSEATIEYNQMRLLEPLISADMCNLAKVLNTDFIGTEYSVKTASSVSNKLQRMEMKFNENLKDTSVQFDHISALQSMKDIIRYTEICNHDSIMDTASRTIDVLESNGYVLSGIKNYYASPYPDTGYQGLHLNFITPYGQEIELQVHSEESFNAKQTCHGLYEQIRSVSTQVADKEILKQEINAVHGAVPKPFNYLSPAFPVSWEHPNKSVIIDDAKRKIFVDLEFQHELPLPHSLAYSIYLDDTMLLCGFENVYTDLSARSYQNNVRDGFAKYSSLSTKGAEIATHSAPQKEISIEEAMHIAQQAEDNHAQWMSQNFSGMQMEQDQEIENSVRQFVSSIDTQFPQEI